MYFIWTSKNNDSNTHYDYNFYNFNINKKIVITGIIIKNNEDNNKITVAIMNLHISKKLQNKKLYIDLYLFTFSMPASKEQ